jgi:hypothetical protein
MSKRQCVEWKKAERRKQTMGVRSYRRKTGEEKDHDEDENSDTMKQILFLEKGFFRWALHKNSGSCEISEMANAVFLAAE